MKHVPECVQLQEIKKHINTSWFSAMAVVTEIVETAAAAVVRATELQTANKITTNAAIQIYIITINSLSRGSLKTNLKIQR